jgi:hypothetical protein
MAKLSKTKEYAISYLHSKNIDATKIATELKIPIDQVNKFIKTLPVDDVEKTSPAKKDKTKNLMIRQTSGKKSNTVSIMTEAASQVLDEAYKTMKPNPKTSETYIFKPRS